MLTDKMEEKGYCKLRMSTFPRYGESQYLQFGDYLIYNRNQLVPGCPEVAIQTSKNKIKIKNPKIMNLPKNHDWGKYTPKNLNDFLVFAACGRRQMLVIDLNISSYLKTLLQDDLREGKNIHIFDLEFRNEYQVKKQFVVEGIFRSMTQDLDKSKKFRVKQTIRLKSDEDHGMFVAKIISHISVPLYEYIKAVKTDPVWRAGLKSYFDPWMHDHYKEYHGLGGYLDRFREQCDIPI